MDKMRIVLIRSNPVRPYPRLEKMVSTLIKVGYKAHVLAWDREATYLAKEEMLRVSTGEVPITRFGIKAEFSAGSKTIISLLRFQLCILAWLVKHKNEYDVIHAYDFDTGFIGSLCARMLNKKLVYDIPDYYVDGHGLRGTIIGAWIQKKENAIIDYADATIICTEKRRNQIKGTNPKRLAVIHNTPQKEQLSEIIDENRFVFDNSKLRIGYVGIFGRTRFLDKIAEFVMRREDCEFHVGGYGQSMEKYFEDCSNLCPRIKYYGKLQYNETLYVESKCDIICAVYDPSIPNHDYAAPNKFYEALMIGKPIIMAKNTGVDEIVADNDIGIVINYDAESFEKAIDEFIKRKEDWKEMGERARFIYETQFSWNVMEKRIVDLYHQIEND